MDYTNLSGMELFDMPFNSKLTTPTQAKLAVREQKPAAEKQAAPVQPPTVPDKPAPKPEAPAPSQQPAATPAQPEKPDGNTAPSQTASTSAPAAQAQPITADIPPNKEEKPKPPEQPKKELELDMSDGTATTDSPSVADDAAKRKAHEEAEAKRKAEWEAKQQKKKQAEEEAIQKLQNMSDEEAVSASTKRITDAVERITRRNMKECVSDHIQDLCHKDPAFARKTMHPHKSMIHCFKYINRMAKEYVRQEMEDNDIKPDNGGYGCDVPDGIVYQWAVDYFNDPDAPEDQKNEEKFVPRPYVSTTTKTKKSASKPKKAAKPAKKQESTNNTYEQLTLGV